MKSRFVAVVVGSIVALLLLESSLRIVGVLNTNKTEARAGQPRDSFRIVCLGDSFTAGVGASLDKSYPRQLEAMLNARAFKRKIRVINRGVGSYNTSQILNELRKAFSNKEENPDLVIILAGGANYLNYWGLYNVAGDNVFKSVVTDFLYRVRVFKLVKYLVQQIKDKIRLAAPAVDKPFSRPLVDCCAEGWHLLGFRKFDEAVGLFKKGLEGSRQKSDCYLGLGNAYIEMKKIDEAVALYHKGMVMYPRECMYYSGLGELYAQQLRYDEAFRWYTKALAVNPHKVCLYTNIGEMYRSQSRFDEAVLWFKKAIKIGPNDARGYMALGCVLFQKQGDYQKAKVYIKKGLALNREHQLFWFSIFCSSLDQPDRTDFFKELIKERLMPSWYMSKDDCSLLVSMIKDGNLDQRIDAWIASDLEKMISLCRANGSKVLLLTYPDYPSAPQIYRLLRLAAICNAVPVIDFKPLFAALVANGAKREDLYAPDGHCNAHGYGVMAHYIAEKILREKIINFE